MADVFLLPSELRVVRPLRARGDGAAACRWWARTPAGCPRSCSHAETGYLLPVGDVEGMATRTIEILKDDERRREMGQAGRRRAEALFGADRVVSQYEAVYNRVLGR